MERKDAEHEDTNVDVDGAAGLVPSEQPRQVLAPSGLNEHARQAGRRLSQERQHEKQVKEALQRTETPDSRLGPHLDVTPSSFSQTIRGFPK
jgi:hypothetical protein